MDEITAQTLLMLIVDKAQQHAAQLDCSKLNGLHGGGRFAGVTILLDNGQSFTVRIEES